MSVVEQAASWRGGGEDLDSRRPVGKDAARDHGPARPQSGRISQWLPTVSVQRIKSNFERIEVS